MCVTVGSTGTVWGLLRGGKATGSSSLSPLGHRRFCEALGLGAVEIEGAGFSGSSPSQGRLPVSEGRTLLRPCLPLTFPPRCPQ